MRLTQQKGLFTLLPLVALAGCTVGPKYVRPAASTPASFRGLAPAIDQAVGHQDSLGDQKWVEVFRDPALQALIREALANNDDLKIAAQHILEQQDVLGITHSQQFPLVSGGGSYSVVGLPSSFVKSLAGDTPTSNKAWAGGLSLSAAWNLDFWGLYRRQTEAARAQLLASEWGQRMVVSTVIENVATSYFQLRTLHAELAITRQTVAAREQSLQLIKTLNQGGSGTLADVRQAEELLHTAQAEIPNLERQIAQQENAISVLLGRNPGPIPLDAQPTQWPRPETIPAGIPSQLLERRPDIQQAEAALIAANANIGVARAQLFPQLSLSGSGGTYSNQLKSLMNGENMYFLASGNLAQTIFDGGRLRSNVRLSEAQKQEQVVVYQCTIRQALQSVSDALVGVQKYREYSAEQEIVTTAAEDATRLAKMRYNGGSTNYLEVLVNDTNYYSAQMNLAVAREQEAVSFVQLYSALGGGWK